ncbi:hypothetical protein L602_002200000120 [Cupriavidus gilardii J11]|uniref:Uncharacterized protein n=1 Tax=Cupriavidus gilardii J11 TaxID=936133 RepID=A0A562BL31_9BURK|nr:hypothetical protein L602_002200000120 [Cupriavidus gilardii J11]
MIALPVQGIAGTVMMICGAAPGTGVAAMMSRHAAVKSQVEAQWRTQSQHAHCHDGDAQDAGAAADNASGATLEPEHADHAGQANAADRPDHAGWAVNDMDGDGPGDPGNPDDNGMAHHHANNGCTACASCALGAALPVGPLDLALSHYRHTLPRSASATMADIRLDTLLRPPADRC